MCHNTGTACYVNAKIKQIVSFLQLFFDFFTKKMILCMADFSKNIVNQRFREVYRLLEKESRIKGKSDLAKHLDTYNHVVNSILNGKRNLTVDQINLLCDHFQINANYMFGTEEDMFQVGSPISDLPTRGMGDRHYEGRNNITLVPRKAMAGYALSLDDRHFLEGLQKFSVPSMEGQLLAFEISGDSMLPNITNGDIVICEPIERDEPLKDNAVYVIVTDVVVAKRIQQIKSGARLSQLRLISDNDVIYKPYLVELEEIRQILRVKSRLTDYGIN